MFTLLRQPGTLLSVLLAAGIFAATSPLDEKIPRVGGFDVVSLPSATPDAVELRFEDRVRYQRAIEEVYWRHRIWPTQNPGPKPSFHDMVPDASVRDRVITYLAKSAALERFWSRPVTGTQLQAELNRMVRDTRNPELLAELFSALDDDPFLIAECLARPVLVDRLVRNWYASDSRFHGALRELAERALADRPNDAVHLRDPGAEYIEVEWRLVPATPEADAESRESVFPVVDLHADEWAEHVERLAAAFGVGRDPGERGEPSALLARIPLGRFSPLVEESSRFEAVSVISRESTSFRTATVSWEKQSFDAWWVGSREAMGRVNLDLSAAPPAAGYALQAPLDAPCTLDSWSSQYAAPAGRTHHTAVWTGTEMIIWGGYESDSTYTNTGGRYDPTTDTWRATSTGDNVPSARSGATAVWTGTEMIVWGGREPSSTNRSVTTNTGGRYDPTTDTWRATSTGDNVPSPRTSATAVWTGMEMIVWGGLEAFPATLNTGGRYRPDTDTWSPTATGFSAPSARYYHTAVWTGTEMIVWGGTTDLDSHLNTGGRYDPASDHWTAMFPGTDTPTARSWHTSVWTGTEMIVWGGYQSTGPVVNTGGRYHPGTDTWVPTGTGSGVPRAKIYHSAVWTGTEMIVWGGEEWYEFDSNAGGRYDPATDSWVATAPGFAVQTEREDHTAVWTGTEMILWGGRYGGIRDQLRTGVRYDPATAFWTPTSTEAPVPHAREKHTAVWTGSEMIIWGGSYGFNPLVEAYTGGRYDPVTDTWTATSTASGVPSGRNNHTAVWTGTEMIVWGGNLSLYSGSSGARYHPGTDTWTRIEAETNEPSKRERHTAVWTGTEMIVWGGSGGGGTILNDGGRYDPAANLWKPVSTASAPDERYGHTAVWTGAEMIVWGGFGPGYARFNTGAKYDPVSDTWTATAEDGEVPVGRALHTAVWTGSEMIVWGGSGPDDQSGINTGGRYDPAADVWTTTSAVSDVPLGRENHTAIWTGTEMIVAGGYGSTYVGPVEFYCACDGGSVSTWYPDADGDGYGVDSTGLPVCEQPPGYVAEGGDCDDRYADCTTDCLDSDSDGMPACAPDCDDSNPNCTADCTDLDADGFCVTTDCDESYAGCTTDCTDSDSDGVPACAPDCDDSNPNCTTDCTDLDADGFCVTTDCDDQVATCNEDCSDTDGDLLPECRDNCPGFYNPLQTDLDEDGWGAGDGCDCDETNPDIYPGAPEIHDGLDNQCPGDVGYGLVDELSVSIRFNYNRALFWPAEIGVTGYEIARSPSPLFDVDCFVVATASTVWTDNWPVPAGVLFHYLVRAVEPYVGSWGADSEGTERLPVCP